MPVHFDQREGVNEACVRDGARVVVAPGFAFVQSLEVFQCEARELGEVLNLLSVCTFDGVSSGFPVSSMDPGEKS